MKKGSEKYRRGVCIVVFKKENEEIKYLLLKRYKHWKGWEFPKGGVEKGESELQTAKREIREETGLNSIKIKHYNKKGKYLYDKDTKAERKFIGQTYSLYSAEVKAGKVKIDKKEHLGFKWVNFASALEKLTWKDQRACLKIVNGEIEDE